MDLFGLSARLALLIIGGSLLLGLLFDRIGRSDRRKSRHDEE